MARRKVPEDAARETILCSITGGEEQTTRSESSGELYLPKGWKRFGDRFVSPGGLANAYCVRSPTIPVASVLVEPKSRNWSLDCCNWSVENCAAGWDDFMVACRTSWQQATAALNWIMTELKALDRQLYQGEKMPKMPGSSHLQKEVVRVFPEIDSQSLYSLYRKALREYGRSRFAMRLGNKSLPSFNYPQPVPIPAKDVELLRSDNDLYFFRVRISGQRFVLRLRGGGEFKRQLNDLRNIANGSALLGEVKIIGRGYRRCQRKDRKKKRQVEVSVAGHFPRRLPTEEKLTMLVGRHDDCFLFAQIEERPQWILNADHIRTVCKAREAFLQRSGEDFKFEKRWPSSVRRSMSAGRNKRLDHYERRLEGWCWQVVASVLGYARRNRVGIIEYDDSPKAYIPELFPWHWLKTMLANKCHEHGLFFQAVSGEETEEEATEPVEAS